jgi:hypothetical protein
MCVHAVQQYDIDEIQLYELYNGWVSYRVGSGCFGKGNDSMSCQSPVQLIAQLLHVLDLFKSPQKCLREC